MKPTPIRTSLLLSLSALSLSACVAQQGAAPLSVTFSDVKPIEAGIPAPVAVAPTPTPIAAPAPIKFSLSADSSFDTAKSALKPEGKAVLDKFATDLTAVTYDSITVIGHADRRGSSTSNQKLSENRANSVKSYLVSQGISASKISASGRGGSEPVTKADDCKKLKGAKLSACMAPDRRVAVSVSGTRTK